MELYGTEEEDVWGLDGRSFALKHIFLSLSNTAVFTHFSLYEEENKGGGKHHNGKKLINKTSVHPVKNTEGCRVKWAYIIAARPRP